MRMCRKATLASLLCLVWIASTAVVSAQPTTPAHFVSEYHELVKKATPLLEEIRAARQRGELIKRDDVLLMRKAVSDLIRKVRKYDQDHVLAARRKGLAYDERSEILTVLRACDGMNRVLDAEIKVNDWLQLVRRYEDSWKQAEQAMPAP